MMRHDHLADCRRWWRQRQDTWARHYDELADIRAGSLDILPEPWRTDSAIAALHHSLIADWIRAQELPPELAA